MENNTYNSIFQSEDSHWWFVGRRKYVNRLLAHFLPDNALLEMCEVGCGSGGNLSMLASYGIVDAMEMDELALDRARQRNVKRSRKYAQGWLPDNMKLTGPYDAVVALDVIEHIEDDVQSLEVIGATLKSSGILVITVPAYQWMWSAHDEANHHKRRYSRPELKKRLEQAGFDVLYASYFNTLMFPVAVLVRIIQRILPRNRALIDEFKMPAPAVNRLLIWLFGLESKLSGRVKIPFGLSISIVAKRSKHASL